MCNRFNLYDAGSFNASTHGKEIPLWQTLYRIHTAIAEMDLPSQTSCQAKRIYRGLLQPLQQVTEMLQLALCTNLHQPFAHAVLSKSSALRQSFRSKWIHTKQSKIARPKKSGIKPDDANSDQTTLRWGVRSHSSCPSLHSCLSFQGQHTKTCTNGVKFHGKTFHLFLKTCKCSFEDKLHQRSQNRCQIPWLQKGWNASRKSAPIPGNWVQFLWPKCAAMICSLCCPSYISIGKFLQTEIRSSKLCREKGQMRGGNKNERDHSFSMNRINQKANAAGYFSWLLQSTKFSWFLKISPKHQ